MTALYQDIIDDISEVELVDFMGDDRTVVNSARVSFGKRKLQLDQKDVKLIDYLARHEHTAPFRHVVFQFRVRAPEFVARQWYKHQVGANFSSDPWSEISQRYVEVDQFYVPRVWRRQGHENKQGSAGALTGSESNAATHLYTQELRRVLKVYRELLDLGVAKEQARTILPLSIYTDFYWTASLQAVAHFCTLRIDAHAQWEIRQYADAVQRLAVGVAPIAYDALKEGVLHV